MKYIYLCSLINYKFLYSVHIVFPLNSSYFCFLFLKSVRPDISPDRSFVWMMQSTFHASFLSFLFVPLFLPPY